MDLSNIFLDTCVILDRESSQKSEHAMKINQFLEQKNKITSTYVNMELNRTYYKDCYTLQTMLEEQKDLGEVERRINEMPPFRERKRLRLILSRITTDSFILHEAKIRLKRIIKYYHTLLLRGISIIPSKTRCEQCLSLNEFKCRGTLSVCKADDIVEKNKLSFTMIHGKLLESLQKNDYSKKKQDTIMKMCGVIAEVIKVPSKIKQNPSNCFKLGDILIALDVPKDSVLVSEDSHFFIVCGVLNVPFWRI